MKALLISTVLALGTPCFAADVSPERFGVQYLAQSISGEPVINFAFTILGYHFPSMNFSRIEASIVDSASGATLAPSKTVYTKQLSVWIGSRETVLFAYKGEVASQIVQALRRSKVIFNMDDGSSFSINLSELCNSQPSAFLNLMGQAGCP